MYLIRSLRAVRGCFLISVIPIFGRIIGDFQSTLKITKIIRPTAKNYPASDLG